MHIIGDIGHNLNINLRVFLEMFTPHLSKIFNIKAIKRNIDRSNII